MGSVSSASRARRRSQGVGQRNRQIERSIKYPELLLTFKYVETYIAEVSQVVGLLAAPGELLAKEGDLEGLVLVLLSLDRVLQIDLINDLSQEIAVEILAEAERKLQRMKEEGAYAFDLVRGLVQSLLAVDLVQDETDLPHDGLGLREVNRLV